MQLLQQDSVPRGPYNIFGSSKWGWSLPCRRHFCFWLNLIERPFDLSTQLFHRYVHLSTARETWYMTDKRIFKVTANFICDFNICFGVLWWTLVLKRLCVVLGDARALARDAHTNVRCNCSQVQSMIWSFLIHGSKALWSYFTRNPSIEEWFLVFYPPWNNQEQTTSTLKTLVSNHKSVHVWHTQLLRRSCMKVLAIKMPGVTPGKELCTEVCAELCWSFDCPQFLA